MQTGPLMEELHAAWLPHLTNSGLARLVDLLEHDSPLLVSGCFSRALPMGCLATHAAWHHPATAHLNTDAGICWLARVAGLNPATSRVIRAWDTAGPRDWPLRDALLDAFRRELAVRRTTSAR